MTLTVRSERALFPDVDYPQYPIARQFERVRCLVVISPVVVNGPLPNSILIVDDNKVIRRAVRQLLESTDDWTVCGEAVDGKDGIEKAQQLNPDVMVLDMSMPGMDGIAVAKVLKDLMPKLPIVMFTNFAEDHFLQREVLSAGIRQVVPKSDSQGLVRAVRAVSKAPAS